MKKYMVLLMALLVLTIPVYLPVHVPEKSAIQTIHHTVKKPVNAGYSFNGSFHASNTSETTPLFMLGYYSAAFIGEIWNVSLALNSNSTTEINITRSALFHWEGPAQFTLHPGETVNHTYVCHTCGDNLGVLFPFFQFKLINHTAEASGQYQAILVREGYRHEGCGTGQIHVSNITAWLDERSSSEEFHSSSELDQTSSELFTGVRWLQVIESVLIAMVLLKVARRKK